MSAIPPGIIIDGASPETQVRNVRPGMGLALYGANSGCSGFRPAADGDDIMWELPSSDGTAGQFLQTNGDGTLSWVSMQTPGMLATPTVLRSPVALPAELLPLLVDTDGQTSTLDTVADYRSLLGLGSAATADISDFATAGDAAAVAAALVEHATLTSEAHGGIAAYTLGDDRSVPVRDGDGRDLIDSSMTVSTGGVAAAAQFNATGDFRAGATGSIYWNTRAAMSSPSDGFVRLGNLAGTNYLTVGHDGTNGSLATSSGDLVLSPASGITSLAASQKIKWGAAGTGMQLSLTTGSNPQLNVRDHTDSYYARIRADTYYWNNGEFLYSDNAKMKFRKAFDAAYLPIWAGTYRAYDANTNYAELSHDGTNGKVQASSGYLLLASPNGNGIRVADYTSRVDVQSTLPTVHLLSNASVIRLGDPSGSVVYGPITHRVASNFQYGIASDLNATSVADIAFMRAGANIGEITTGAAGQRAALYTGTHRVYDQSLNTAYLALSHNGTDATVAASAGTMRFQAASGGLYRFLNPAFPSEYLEIDGSGNAVIRHNKVGGRIVISVNGPKVFSNEGLWTLYHDTTGHTSLPSSAMFKISSTSSADGATDIAFGRAGVSIGEINNGTAGQRAALYAGTVRAYDTALNTAYVALSHDGTRSKLTSSSGSIRQVLPSARYIEVDDHWFGTGVKLIAVDPANVAATALYLGNDYNGSKLSIKSTASNVLIGTENNTNLYSLEGGWRGASTTMLGWTSTSNGSAAADTAIERVSAGMVGFNNGTAGTFRDTKCRYSYATHGFVLNNSTIISSLADGNLVLTYNAGSNFNMFQLGGVTLAYPAIKRNGTGIDIRLADDSAYTGLYTGTQRAYDSTQAKYLVMEHNGSYGDIYTSADDLMLRAANSGSYLQIRSGDWYWASAGTGIFYMSSNGTSLANGKQYGFTSGSTGGSNDVAIARRSGGGGIESNNGTIGTLRDVYARTFYGIAQASTDVALCAQAHASQGSTSPVLKVINSAGGNMFRVLPDRTVVDGGYLDLANPTDGAGAIGRNYIICSYGNMHFNAGNYRVLSLTGGEFRVGGLYGTSDAIITNADPGSGLRVKVIDHYGGANTAGKDLIYQAGRPTGNAVGGAHRFKVAPSPGVSGTTFGTLTDTVVIDGTDGTSGALTAIATAVGSTPLVSKGKASQTAPYWEGQTSVGTRGPHISSTAPSVTADCAGALRFGTLNAFVGFNSTDWLVLEGGNGTLCRHVMTFGTAMQNRFTTDGHFSAQDPTDGFKLGTADTQKIGFWNATPVVQQVLPTGTGKTVDDVIAMLQTIGLCKQS